MNNKIEFYNLKEKTVLFLVYPIAAFVILLFAALILAFAGLFLVAAWFIIPFIDIQKNAGKIQTVNGTGLKDHIHQTINEQESNLEI